MCVFMYVCVYTYTCMLLYIYVHILVVMYVCLCWCGHVGTATNVFDVKELQLIRTWEHLTVTDFTGWQVKWCRKRLYERLCRSAFVLNVTGLLWQFILNVELCMYGVSKFNFLLLQQQRIAALKAWSSCTLLSCYACK